MLKTFILLGLLLLPTLALASCSPIGTTVIYINGVNTTLVDAKTDLGVLSKKFRNAAGDTDVKFLNGYNPTHLAGLGDNIESFSQMLDKPISDYDLDTILMQIYPELTTRKVLVMGHSQGALYANEIYDYFLSHGEPKESVREYALAVPTDHLSQAGAKYLNSSGDTILAALRIAGVPVLPNDIDLAITSADAKSDWPGHSFPGAYLAQASGRIVSDIQNELSDLQSTYATNDDAGCFTPPNPTAAYKTQQIFFAAADPTAQGIKIGTHYEQVALQTLSNAGVAAISGAFGAVGKVASDLGVFAGGLNGLAHAANPQYQSTNYDITSKLYGGDNQTVDGQSLQDLLGNNQGGAVILATEQPASPPADQGTEPQPDTSADTPPASVPAPALIPVNTSPGFGGGGGGGSPASVVSDTPVSEDTTVDETASSTTGTADASTTDEADTASSTPAVPTGPLFDASTPAPALTVNECGHSLSTGQCLIQTASISLVWSDIGADHYNVLLNNAVVETITGTSTTLALGDSSSNTVQVVAYDASTTPVALPSNTVNVGVFLNQMAGFFCDGDSSVLTPQTSPVQYHPTSDVCFYFGGFSAPDWTMRGQLYKGVVGSSTLVDDNGTNIPFNKELMSNHYGISSATPGDQYFVALFEYNNNIGGTFNTYLVPDMDHYLATGVQNDGTTVGPPSLTYYIIPFVIQ